MSAAKQFQELFNRDDGYSSDGTAARTKALYHIGILLSHPDAISEIKGTVASATAVWKRKAKPSYSLSEHIARAILELICRHGLLPAGTAMMDAPTSPEGGSDEKDRR
jgi:hypothetical protein